MAGAHIEVAAGLVFHRGELLITQRPPGTHLAGLWEFPGGKKEPGETIQECLVRELREELGIEVEAGATLQALEHVYPEKTVRLEFIVCRWTAGQPQPIGCSDFCWIRQEELKNFEFPPADERILELLKERSELWGKEH